MVYIEFTALQGDLEQLTFEVSASNFADAHPSRPARANGQVGGAAPVWGTRSR